MPAAFQPVDQIANVYNTNTNGGSSQDRQAITLAAASVYGQAYNASRARQQNPTDARAEARAAAQDFINMEFKRD